MTPTCIDVSQLNPCLMFAKKMKNGEYSDIKNTDFAEYVTDTYPDLYIM